MQKKLFLFVILVTLAMTSVYADNNKDISVKIQQLKQALKLNKNDITSLNNLAAIYYKENNYSEAESLYERSLAIREKTLGKEHLDVAASLYNLAEVYSKSGRSDESGQKYLAESLFKRSLAIREKILGRNSFEVAQVLKSLAWIYRMESLDSSELAKGKHAEAKSFYKEALAIAEKSLGKNHLEVASFLDGLAVLYVDEKDYRKAESLYQHSLAIREKALGEHIDVATNLDALANVYMFQHKYANAEFYYLKCLAIREKVLGKYHRDVAETLSVLSLVYKAQDKHEQEKLVYDRSIEILKKLGLCCEE